MLIAYIWILSFLTIFYFNLQKSWFLISSGFLLPFLLMTYWYGQLNFLSLTFTLVGELPVVKAFALYFVYGLDGVSVTFIILTTFIFGLIAMINVDMTKHKKSFLLTLLAVEVLLVITFISLDILFFYIFFEAILIPMFILIGVWGARERKIKAAYYFFMYTLLGSIFMLFAILNIYFICGTTHYDALASTPFEFNDQILLWVCLFIAFAVKVPSFPFHVWLPEAHVEAPTIGSVILASLLLKLGGYGFMRFMIPILPLACETLRPVVYGIAILSILYASLAAIRQIDLKKIIAYSSVAHMNVVVLGLFANNTQGVDGGFYLMIAHGVVSGALFFCVGVLYDRYHTRLIRYYGGLVQTMPIFTIIFFVFTLANMGFPGTANFIGELLVFVGLFQTNIAVMIMSATGVVLSAVYSIWLFGRVCFGTLKVKYIGRYIDITLNECLILVPLLVGAIGLGLNSQLLITEQLTMLFPVILVKKNLKKV